MVKKCSKKKKEQLLINGGWRISASQSISSHYALMELNATVDEGCPTSVTGRCADGDGSHYDSVGVGARDRRKIRRLPARA